MLYVITKSILTESTLTSRESALVNCRCAVKAAAALKDKHGGRAAAAVLVPYGESLGIHQPDPVVLSPEQLAAWERHYDPKSGHSFFYSRAYDAAIWEGAVKLNECSGSSSSNSISGQGKSSKQDVIQHAHRHLYSSHRLVLQEKPPAADDEQQQKRPTSKEKLLK
jgi:hypothetical protein